MNVLYWILGLISFIVIMAISIAMHEGSHMLAAKALKIPVPKFFIGFGPTIWSKEYKGTEYGIKAIPLGGFVKVVDTNQEEGTPERELLSYITPWKRIIVFIAGALMNLVLGISLLFGLLMTTPIQTITSKVNSVNTCQVEANNCSASKSELKANDQLISINGINVQDPNNISSALQSTNTIVVLRDNKTITLHNVKTNADKHLGIMLATSENNRNFTESVNYINNYLHRSLHVMATIPDQVPNLAKSITGQEKRSPDSVSSVVGAGQSYADTAASNNIDTNRKVKTILLYSAILNIGLGIANILPMMPLDGGRIMIAVFDTFKIIFSKISRRKYNPVSNKTIMAITAVTGTMVGLFMMLTILADIFAPIQTK